MKRIVKVAAIIIVIMAACWYLWPAKVHTAAKAASNTWTCAEDQAPCVALLDGQNHTIATFNDFHFGSNHCISFAAYPAKAWKNYCGTYTLKWIGPSGQKSIPQQG